MSSPDIIFTATTIATTTIARYYCNDKKINQQHFCFHFVYPFFLFFK